MQDVGKSYCIYGREWFWLHFYLSVILSTNTLNCHYKLTQAVFQWKLNPSVWIAECYKVSQPCIHFKNVICVVTSPIQTTRRKGPRFDCKPFEIYWSRVPEDLVYNLQVLTSTGIFKISNIFGPSCCLVVRQLAVSYKAGSLLVIVVALICQSSKAVFKKNTHP